jgi:hypothetical protein
LDLSNGIPSHDRFNAILNAIKPEEFEPMLLAWLDVVEHHTKESAHGRVDERSYYLCEVPMELPDKSRWKRLAAIGMSINNSARRNGDEIAVRYYRLSPSRR